MSDEVELYTVCTHEKASGDRWQFVAPPEINPVSFGQGQSTRRQGSLRYALPEWRKGGRIIEWLIARNIRAVVMLGYNDPGRLRIIRWCRRNQVPLLLWVDSNIHGDNLRGFKALLKRRTLGWILHSCAGLLPCGSRGRDYFIKYGGRADRMFYFPVEPDYDLVTGLAMEFVEKIRMRYDLARKRQRFVFSARMIPAKRPDLLIEAFCAIADRRPNWDLLMVGEGPLREQLMARIPARLTSRIIWTGFLDDQSVVSALYRLSDCLVLPSEYEPWALVINEAAAAGLAIISTNIVGASAELVRDGVNGRLVPPGDLPALVEAMLDVSQTDRVGPMKSGSSELLNHWRNEGDPIRGLRHALQFCGVI